MIADLKQRFNDSAHSVGLLYLLPTRVPQDADIPPELFKAVDFYKDDLPHQVMFPTEFRMWARKWKLESQSHDSELPSRLVDTLQACDATTYPNINVLLQLALTLPVTSCECERSFSQLKLVKTTLRSTKTGDRLSSLVHMKINRSACEKLHSSPDTMHELVTCFAQLHPRRMNMSFVLSE